MIFTWYDPIRGVYRSRRCFTEVPPFPRPYVVERRTNHYMQLQVRAAPFSSGIFFKRYANPKQDFKLKYKVLPPSSFPLAGLSQNCLVNWRRLLDQYPRSDDTS